MLILSLGTVRAYTFKGQGLGSFLLNVVGREKEEQRPLLGYFVFLWMERKTQTNHKVLTIILLSLRSKRLTQRPSPLQSQAGFVPL